MRLAEKVAIITGAGSGIGRACAIAFAREGAQVALVGRRKERLEAVAREIGGAPVVVVADIVQKADTDRVVNLTAKHFGRIDVLLNNAGVLFPGTVEEITEEQWDQTFDTNVKGVWRLSRNVLPHMRKAGGGSIINVASTLVWWVRAYGLPTLPRRERSFS